MLVLTPTLVLMKLVFHCYHPCNIEFCSLNFLFDFFVYTWSIVQNINKQCSCMLAYNY